MRAWHSAPSGCGRPSNPSVHVAPQPQPQPQPQWNARIGGPVFDCQGCYRPFPDRRRWARTAAPVTTGSPAAINARMSRPIVEGETSSQPAIRAMAPRSSPSSSTSSATRTRRCATAGEAVDAGFGTTRGLRPFGTWPLLDPSCAARRLRTRGEVGISSESAGSSASANTAAYADRGTAASPRNNSAHSPCL
ncbi:MAG: hypothetical protein QOJ59_2656 [Thermomicrobiales bacterium]|nr:hypothetical protein [Thermomicrobiales bacterium]